MLIPEKKKRHGECWLMFFSLCFVRILSALFNPIPDCDETYNYWEPLHLLLYKNGLQTWEYSPEYGLRSYFFILLHSPMAYLGRFLQLDKIVVFFLVRCYIGVICGVSELFFINSIKKCSLFGEKIARITFFCLLLSSGMFNFGQNFLPGSFSMICLFFSFGSWIRSYGVVTTNVKWHLFWCYFAAAASILIGWPFTVVCIFPMLLESLWRLFTKVSFMEFAYWCFSRLFIIAGILLGSSISIDYFYFQKFQFTAFNLAWYNRGSGSENFGTEPWHYYVRNLVANYNILFLASLVSPLLALFLKGKRKVVLFLIPYFAWILFYSSVPHKEERFMAPVASLLSFAGALGIAYAASIVKKVVPKTIANLKTLKRSIIVIFILSFAGLSVLRVISSVSLYSAPMRVWKQVSDELQSYDPPAREGRMVKVCVGKEWYRFMTSFYLPHNYTRLHFVKSKFDGLLPKYFKDGPDATYSIPDGMNDGNNEEMDRYVPENRCHYLVDFDFVGQREKRYFRDKSMWEIIYEDKFLDVGQSKSSLARAFYIPFYSKKHNRYGTYYVVKNTSPGLFQMLDLE